MYNSGFKPTKFDGSEEIYDVIQNEGLPLEYSYLSILPKVLNQGSDPICVPCSISAYINWKLNMKDGITKDNRIKILDIFESRTNYGEGMTFKDALEFIKAKGVDFKGGHISIDRYARITNPLTLKMALFANGPCMGVLPVRNPESTGNFWNKEEGDVKGYHAVSIVGYNQDGFIIRNSWGTSYGSNGYGLLKNEDINNFVELWTII